MRHIVPLPAVGTVMEPPVELLPPETDAPPAFAPEFARGQADTKAVMLPKVGHGFGAPRNWMAQYRESLREVLEAQHR